MKVSRATSLWTLGLLVALSAAACEAVDHTVGEGTNDELLNPSGGGDSPAGGDDNGEGGSDDAEGGGGIWADGSVSAGVTATTGDNQTGPAVTGAGGGGTGTGPAVTGASSGGTGTGPAVTGASSGTGGASSGTGGASSGTGGASSGTGSASSGTGSASSGVNGSVNSSSGGANTASGSVSNSSTSGSVWDLPIPDNCTEVQSGQYETECELEVDCGGASVVSQCLAFDGGFDCGCPTDLDGVEFRLTGVTLADACSHTLTACLNWHKLDAGALECLMFTDTDEPNLCIAHDDCTLEGVIGDANFTATLNLISTCYTQASGWICSCGSPYRPWFEFETTTSDPQCLDARGWCTGEAVERIGSRTCTPSYTSEGEFGCTAEMDCEQAVLLSGQEATMHEVESVGCELDRDGLLYQCTCEQNAWSTEVAADDPSSACAAAVNLCADAAVPMP